MSQRYTRKDAENAFALLLSTLGKREATSWNDVGGWRLDYNGVYGGYVVEEVCNEHGGITHPLGHMRRPAREFCDGVHLIRYALMVKEG